MSGEQVLVENRGTVAVITLNHGVTNALGPGLVGELHQVIRQTSDDPGVRAQVLTSANDKFFSIGWDIPRLLPLDPTEFLEFFRAFHRAATALYSSPKPTVAGITGHATAGGCILALCCDRRIMTKERRLLGLNEVKLGVTVPYDADCILRDLVGSRLAGEVMEGGEFHLPSACLEMGLVDRVTPSADVRTTAVEVAASLGLPPTTAFAAIKRNRVEGVLARIAQRADEREREFVELWYSPTARARLQEATARF